MLTYLPQLVDILSAKYDVVARVAGGSNAGHTIYVEVRACIRAYMNAHVYISINQRPPHPYITSVPHLDLNDTYLPNYTA